MLYFRFMIFLYIQNCKPDQIQQKSDDSLENKRNYVSDVHSSCTYDNMNINITMKSYFKGVVFAKDFSQQCRSYEINNNTVSLKLSTNSCGIRLVTKNTNSGPPNGYPLLYYQIQLVIQMDKHLRQIVDQEITVVCYLKNDYQRKNFHKNSLKLAEKMNNKNLRTYRMNSNFSEDESLYSNNIENLLDFEKLNNAKAWMELKNNGDIDNDNQTNDSGIIKVGDLMDLSIKSLLPENIGWKVVDCMAYDGLDDLSQKLLDENGCPIDTIILPELTYSKAKMINMSKNKTNKQRKKINLDKIIANSRNKRTIVKKTGEELKDFDKIDDYLESVEQDSVTDKNNDNKFVNSKNEKISNENIKNLEKNYKITVNNKDNIEKNDVKFPQLSASNLMKYQEASVKFPAFKFPDRNRLHFKCNIHLCIGECPKTNCDTMLANRASRQLTSEIDFSDASETLIENEDITNFDDLENNENDRLEVYNSVEVIAPELEIDNYKMKKIGSQDKFQNYQKIITNNDKKFCVSSNKITITFCLLGIIFAIASLVALFSLSNGRFSNCIRSRFSTTHRPNSSYYTRSLFSSSTSTLSGAGCTPSDSKLLHQTSLLSQPFDHSSNSPSLHSCSTRPQNVWK